MNTKETGKKAIVPCASAVLGGAIVVAALKFSLSVMAKVNSEVDHGQHDEQVYDDIFKRQESIRSQFDSLFNDNFIGQHDPFEEMKKIRKQMQKRMKIFDNKSGSRAIRLTLGFLTSTAEALSMIYLREKTTASSIIILRLET